MSDEKLRGDDEGPLSILIGIRDNHIIMHFGKPVEWIGLHPGNAEEIGRNLIEKAKEIRQKGG